MSDRRTESERPSAELHYRWQRRLKSSPEALWPLVADTNRFDKDARLPIVSFADPEGPARDNGRRDVFLTWMGQRIEWVEEPFQWVRPHRLSVTRHYTRGPLRRLTAAISLATDAGAGTLFTYELFITPANLLGRLAAPIQLGRVFKRNVNRVIALYDREAASAARAAADVLSNSTLLESTRGVVLAPGGNDRLSSFEKSLIERGSPPALVERLARAIRRGDDLDLHRMRPYAFADRWGDDRRAVLELFLSATRAGMLEFQWEILCPMCRGSKSKSARLAELAESVHCEACQIDFTANFDQLVELTFHPSASIRPISVADYCVGSPQRTPHIAVQQLLAPAESVEVNPNLERGRYRVRASQIPGGGLLDAEESPPRRRGERGEENGDTGNKDKTGDRADVISISENGWPDHPITALLTPSITLRNDTEREQLVAIERMEWSDQAATAAQVTALQAFRDLFSTEALRPGQRISVGSVTLMFTDLRGSTAMYREIGDAPAFGTVMEHFEILKSIIARHNGAVIKTIGDAVMAVFRNPADAVRAAIEAQHTLAHPACDVPDSPTSRNGAAHAQPGAVGLPRALTLKAALHTGPCIAVTLNDRLDYFGSTVNIAARLVALSRGDDVVISDEVRADAEVRELLRSILPNGACANEECELRGITDRRFSIARLPTMAFARQ